MFIKEDARNAPVGGHTCLTAGERSEPAVVVKAKGSLYRSP